MMGGEEKQNSVFKTMILFSLAMCFLPVFLYFFSKSAFFEGKALKLQEQIIMNEGLDGV